MGASATGGGGRFTGAADAGSAAGGDVVPARSDVGSDSEQEVLTAISKTARPPEIRNRDNMCRTKQQWMCRPLWDGVKSRRDRHRRLSNRPPFRPMIAYNACINYQVHDT